ncbi:asparagine synthase (glutamine-hydrolyzing) [Nocardioides flavus (ex Wang et al. 2016)]|uniref:asparagine synthase (glutamine-hydrolyzing) n=1 Tax=Nocardioides flavus (ex Wang et al. 2016) TaxID=2058780 RepID=A0ABQ3HMP5_9ACTN|nr:asparagine synthase (glutamine-hydrolyzing) [Nocardioides flavus (ex Wang et al. 2016)]GHE18183.1 asparagine synthase (glutamine-hydrolyzing) [Nocardioides flavus (ex Wang et al. 2016)]
MCGIAGIQSQSDLPDTDLLLRMMTALSHRGPDGSGYYRDESVALGHTRLAIIDPGLGVQPMCGEREDVWVTFNGEIFNYVELRAQLADRGHDFRTHSDTEVIVHAWEEWGPGCFERFNGQWALAIWDRRTSELVLCRDRLGVRPLYHASAGDRLVFASEVKALFADPQVVRGLDPLGLDQVFTFWSAVAPRTVFAGVSQVRPGTYVVCRDGVVGEPQTFWQPTFPERGGGSSDDLDAHAGQLRERLIHATRLRFERSDFPVGAYLSGGIDSAVTAGIIREFTDADLHTFSLRFADAEYDEGEHQATMARRLGTSHRDVVVSHRDIGEVFPEVVRHAETPLLRTAPAPMFLLSRLVRDSGYKVVVTGEGSDEVLAGYDIFREARVREFWARDPGAPQRARAIELLYPWLGRNPNQAPAFARGFFGRNLDPADLALSHRPRWDSTSSLKAMLAGGWSEGVSDAAADLVGRMPAEASGWDGLSRAQWLEMSTLLPGYILASQGDRMLMANSVEGRFPFLDADVIELAGRLPARQKILGLDEKHLLKRAFRDLLPPEIVARPKQPYRAPDASGFVGVDAPDWVADVTSPEAVDAAGVFKPVVVRSLLEKARRSRGRALSHTDSMRVSAVLSVQLLHEQFMGHGHARVLARPPHPTAVFDLVDSQRSTAWR